MVTPLDTWFAGEAARRRFRRRWLGRAPVVLPPRDRAWRRIAPGFAACAAMAASGLPFQIVADRRYDRAGDRRRLPGAPRPRPGGVLVPLPRRGPWAPWHGPAPRRRRGLVLAPARGAARGDARP